MPLHVLLIRPAGHFSSLVYPDGPWVGVPLSLLYVAAAARRIPGTTVKILDALAEPDFDAIEREEPPYLFGMTQERISAEAEAFQPDVIGVSVAAETFYPSARSTIASLRDRFPKAFLVAGGTDPSMQTDRYLREVPGLDAVIAGEGEVAFENLLRALESGTDWRLGPGIAHIDASGAVQRTPPAWVENLDDYVLDWDELDLERYFELERRGFPSRQSVDYPGSDRAVYLVTSRGCPYRCAFCSIHITMGKRFRAHSAEHVLREITLLARKRAVHHFHFEDDNLSLDADRLRTILQGLVDANLGVTWDTPNGVRADRFDRELVELSKRSGCIYLMFGVESGSQAVLDGIAKKDLGLADVERTVSLCHEAGLDNMALFIFGLPGETKSTVRETYRFAFDLFRRYGTVPFVSLYKPYPGTPLHETCQKSGWLVDARPYERMGKIPYMLFMPTMMETPDLEIWFLVDLYQQYMLKSALNVLHNAMRHMWRHPLLALQLVVRVLGRVLRNPSRFMPLLREFFWRVLLFPRAQVRLRNHAALATRTA